MKRLLVPAVSCLALTGCADILLDPDPPMDPVVVFDELWEEFDRYYSHFEIKAVDWGALREVYRPRVTPATTDGQLFAVFSDLLDELRDGHVNLWTPFALYAWTAWADAYPESFAWPRIAIGYLRDERTAAGGVRWGRVAPGVGYVLIPTFADRAVVDGVDAALAALSGEPQLVLDVRHNGGGSDNHAVAIAGRFADAAYHYRTVQYRNGPAHDDYAVPRLDSVRPAGPIAYRGTIALLTNRRVFSAAEAFVLAMRVLPSVTVVGDTTGGGAGNPITRELSNGWVYRIPRWVVWLPEGGTYEGVGLAPDVFVQFDPAESAGNGDPILDSALARLAPQERVAR